MKMNTKQVLSKDNTLRELQAYTKEMCQLNGWHDYPIERKWLLFTEEVGELAKAIRKEQSFQLDEQKQESNAKQSVSDELADVLLYTLDIANTLGVDLQEAIKQKEEINRHRSWK